MHGNARMKRQIENAHEFGLRPNVLITYDVDNLDSHAKGNFSQDEFHGTALSATNHRSQENQ